MIFVIIIFIIIYKFALILSFFNIKMPNLIITTFNDNTWAAWWQINATPLTIYWSFISFALNHQDVIQQDSRKADHTLGHLLIMQNKHIFVFQTECLSISVSTYYVKCKHIIAFPQTHSTHRVNGTLVPGPEGNVHLQPSARQPSGLRSSVIGKQWPPVLQHLMTFQETQTCM